jgi:hypothetical protein
MFAADRSVIVTLSEALDLVGHFDTPPSESSWMFSTSGETRDCIWNCAAARDESSVFTFPTGPCLCPVSSRAKHDGRRSHRTAPYSHGDR